MHVDATNQTQVTFLKLENSFKEIFGSGPDIQKQETSSSAETTTSNYKKDDVKLVTPRR